jgi:hypothetical protein
MLLYGEFVMYLYAVVEFNRISWRKYKVYINSQYLILGGCVKSMQVTDYLENKKISYIIVARFHEPVQLRLAVHNRWLPLDYRIEIP